MPDRTAHAMAADLLERVVDHYADAGVDLPAARYVAPGGSQTIAYDYPAVQVCVDFISPGQPGNDLASQPQAFLGLHYAQFAVTVIREIAVVDDRGDPPTPDRIGADAQTHITDLTTLQSALERIRDTSRTAESGWAARGTPVAVGRTQSVGPQGGVVAAVGVIQAEVAPT